VETRNHLDNAVYGSEKLLKEHRDKVPEADAKAVEEAVADAKKAIEEGSLEKMQKAQDNLQKVTHKLAEAMYKSSAQQAPPSGENAAGSQPPPPPKDKDDVVDAEFVDVEDKNKKS
jgi:molecular chaperone DnaK